MNLTQGVTSGPGTHALIVGISAYSNLPVGATSAPPTLLGLRQLESCALTAFRIRQWLLAHANQLAKPIASTRLLVVPSSAELAVEPELTKLSHGCTFDDFAVAADAWRNEISSDPGNQALFYFAGHGAQRSSGSHVMLMQDFGKGAAIFGKAVDTEQLLDGMKPSSLHPKMGLSQMFFIDCCRVRPAFTRKFDQTPREPCGISRMRILTSDPCRSFTRHRPAGRLTRARLNRQSSALLFSSAWMDVPPNGS